jgi:glycosyltransferase involved in cell wall biosynthesis
MNPRHLTLSIETNGGSPLRILVLTKRKYMGKDLLDDRFGRFRELPLGLARLGHEVAGLAFSYRRREEGATLDSDRSETHGVMWHSINATNGFAPQLGKAVRQALKLAKDFKPDLIWACSDAYQAIFGVWLARRIETRCVIDLYDNFEAFQASRLPGVLPLFRNAVKAADGVTCFSKRLASYVMQSYLRTKPTAVIENGTRKDFFYPRDQKECRQRLNLPENARIIGTAGALDTSRGIATLFQAFELLAVEFEDLHLALAGPRKRRLRLPNGRRLHDLGVLPHEEVPTFFNSLDVGVVCYRQSPQGEYSFPQKAYEIMACRVPLMAAAVGTMIELLGEYPQCLYEPGSPESLAEGIRWQLKNRTVVDAGVPAWTDSAKRLHDFLEATVHGNPNDHGSRSTLEMRY